MGLRQFREAFPEYDGYMKSIQDRQTQSGFGHKISHKSDQSYNRDLLRLFRYYRQYWCAAAQEIPDSEKIYELGVKIDALQKRMNELADQNIKDRYALTWDKMLSKSYAERYLYEDFALLSQWGKAVKSFVSETLELRAKDLQDKPQYIGQGLMSATNTAQQQILGGLFNAWLASWCGIFGVRMPESSVEGQQKPRQKKTVARQDVEGAPPSFKLHRNKKFDESAERVLPKDPSYLTLAFVRTFEIPSAVEDVHQDSVPMQGTPFVSFQAVRAVIPEGWRVVAGARKLPPQSSTAELSLV